MAQASQLLSLRAERRNLAQWKIEIASARRASQ